MNTNVPFRIVIEGTADALFLESVAKDFLDRANQYTSITFEAGQSARVPLIREASDD
jgi:hypothetical protein